MEIWKEIKGYEDIYQISNFGRVRSLARLVRIGDGVFKPTRNRILKPNKRNSYHSVNLYYPAGVSKTKMIHRLVAIHFKRKPHSPRKNVVNHVDCNKLNNHHSNLEWVTHLENCRHAKANGRMKVPFTRGEKNGRSILTEVQVIEIINLFGKKNNVQIARSFGISKNTILDIKSGRTWKHLNRGTA